MAYAMYSSDHSGLWTSQGSTVQASPNPLTSHALLEDGPDDPVRTARNNWVVQHTHVSDSSSIIDSIDVDMVDVSQDESSVEVYIVLDTNVLIHQLFVLKQTLAHIEAPGAELNIVLLVPGIVVSELDHQKNSSRIIANDSRKASDWLAGEIGNGRGRVKGQAYTQTMLPSGDWRQRSGLTNDELILDCCKYFSHIKRKDVLLCTSDNNLAVQASSNAGNLFMRDVSGVVRPRRELWDAGQLLERALPGFETSLAASMHAPGSSRRRGGRKRIYDYSNPDPSSASHAPVPRHAPVPEDDASMEIDMDGGVSAIPHSAGNQRDLLHRQMSAQLTQRLRKLTAQAAALQQSRRQHQSMHSPANAGFKGELPNRQDQIGAWSLRECLKFVANVSPPQPRSWTFGEGEASSLADFLAMPGEKGARRGREWAKHDWGRELGTVQRLGKDFQIEELDASRMAEYEYAVMEIFAVD